MPPNVAIACQGGGSHTAFAAGVLAEALPWIERTDARLVGLSGTSGGALSAVAAWYGYLDEDAARAVEIIGDLWADVAISTPAERVLNDWLVWGMATRTAGFPVPAVSPYAVPWTEMGEAQFRSLVARHVDFERVRALAGPDSPKLVVGTVDVESGTVETFENGAVSLDAVVASSAVPSVFEAVEIGGHGHWDGLFAQNPPITELLTVEYARKPDELWIVQINPQRTDGVPKSRQAIMDRRRELSANVGAYQQAQFVEAINRWVREGLLPPSRFKEITVRTIVLDRAFSLSTKLKRTESFIEEVHEEGRSAASATIDAVEADRVM